MDEKDTNNEVFEIGDINESPSVDEVSTKNEVDLSSMPCLQEAPSTEKSIKIQRTEPVEEQVVEEQPHLWNKNAPYKHTVEHCEEILKEDKDEENSEMEKNASTYKKKLKIIVICLLAAFILAVVLPTVILREKLGTESVPESSTGGNADSKNDVDKLDSKEASKETDGEEPFSEPERDDPPTSELGAVEVNPSPTPADKPNTPIAKAVWTVLSASLQNTSGLNEQTSLDYIVYDWLVTDPTPLIGRNETYLEFLLGVDNTTSLEDIVLDEYVSTKIVQRYTLALLDAALQKPSSASAKATTTDSGLRGRLLQQGETVSASSLVPTFAIHSYDECQWLGVTCANITIAPNNDTIFVVDKIVWANQGLTGEIPPQIKSLWYLTYLDLAENELTGHIPHSIYEMASLEHLFLHNNRLTGELSTKIGYLLNLDRLFLNNNMLQGTIPQEIGSPALGRENVRPLRYLNLYNNSFHGPLPQNLNLGNLYYLDLGHNKLTGTIPDDWVYGQSSMRVLRSLYLDHNQLSGTLPAMFPKLGLGRIQQVYLNDNNFTGSFSFQAQYEVNDKLNSLEIYHNGFTGLTDDICKMNVFNEGELVNLKADCEACSCKEGLCNSCY